MHHTDRSPEGDMTNVRLVNKWRENGGEYTIRVDVPADMARVQRDLAQYQSEEPTSDWHLEYRGTHTSWHREAK